VAGKGGVGKSTVGASLGVAAAEAGFDVLLIELEGHSNLGAAFGLNQLSYDSQIMLDSGTTLPDHVTQSTGANTVDQTNSTRVVKGRLRGRQITPDAALHDYLETTEIGKFASRLARSGVVELVATAAPGIRDVLALGKVRQLEQSGEADLIIVDAPAAGHALTFLRSASGLANAVSSGPVRQQADQVLELLGDPARCQATLVTLAEETPVSELIDTAFRLEDEVNIALTPIVVNNVLGQPGESFSPVPTPRSTLVSEIEEATTQRQTKKLKTLLAAAHFRVDKQQAQRCQIDRLAAELPLEQIILPTIFSSHLDLGDMARLAASITLQLGSHS